MTDVEKVVEVKEIETELVEEVKKIAEPESLKTANWVPRTELGRAARDGRITSIEQIWSMGKVIKEPEIVDFFLRDLEERILKVGKGKRPFKWVQRMTDSGRRNKYSVMVAVGNKNGFVGLGLGRAKEYSGAIASAIRNAKLSVIKVKKGCGSWDCGCGGDHSIPIESTGKCGSVKVLLKPAPKGTGRITSEISKDILELAGIKDVWSYSNGHTKTRANLAKATFNSLENLSSIKK